MSSRRTVALVFGGRSPEHSVSCMTASGIAGVIDRSLWDVVAVGLTRDGRWVAADAPQDVTVPGDDGLPQVRDDPDARPGGQPPAVLTDADVVLPLLHGAYGEDGTLQGLLEMGDVRYVGAGVLASAAAMDKDIMKIVLAAAGLPVCRWVRLDAASWDADPGVATAQVATLGWPVFVKPARAGSSFGISKVADPADLPAAVAHAFAFDPKIIVEETVHGREVELGVLQSETGGPPDVSVPGEVVVSGDHEFYDFEAKYTDAAALRLVIPAPLDDTTVSLLRAQSATAFDALGCEGLARVDFFVTPEGRTMLNEVNTLPGFTPSSMFPRLWAATGLGYPALVHRLLATAAARSLGLR